MTAIAERRVGGGKKVRGRQRVAHLVAGLVLVVYVYVPGGPGVVLETAVRWVVVPALVGSGVVMWQWAKIRRWMRKRASRA
jgi:hypothetical protein